MRQEKINEANVGIKYFEKDGFLNVRELKKYIDQRENINLTLWKSKRKQEKRMPQHSTS